MKINCLFLDDFRFPRDAYEYTFDPEYLVAKWNIVRSHDAFVEFVTKKWNEDKTLPELISFDHDLIDAHYQFLEDNIPYEDFKEKTGYHSAKWLVEFCIDNNIKLPRFKVHSMNPGGSKNIKSLLENFNKHQEL